MAYKHPNDDRGVDHQKKAKHLFAKMDQYKMFHIRVGQYLHENQGLTNYQGILQKSTEKKLPIITPLLTKRDGH